MIGLDGEVITSAVYETGTNVLAIIGNSGGTYDLNLLGSYQQSDFPVTNGEIVMPCFLRGTRIVTPRGEISVEELAIGDLVQVRDAGVAPIKWIGHRCVDCRCHPKPQKVWPVRVRAGAFGDGLPRRDLWLSPDHAVFVDDVLIPIKRLVNGTSIEQVAMDQITYYHVELAHHDVLLAEGPAGGILSRHRRPRQLRERRRGRSRCTRNSPRAAWDTALMWEALACAPLIVTGPGVGDRAAAGEDSRAAATWRRGCAPMAPRGTCTAIRCLTTSPLSIPSNGDDGGKDAGDQHGPQVAADRQIEGLNLEMKHVLGLRRWIR